MWPLHSLGQSLSVFLSIFFCYFFYSLIHWFLVRSSFLYVSFLNSILFLFKRKKLSLMLKLKITTAADALVAGCWLSIFECFQLLVLLLILPVSFTCCILKTKNVLQCFRACSLPASQLTNHSNQHSTYLGLCIARIDCPLVFIKKKLFNIILSLEFVSFLFCCC